MRVPHHEYPGWAVLMKMMNYEINRNISSNFYLQSSNLGSTTMPWVDSHEHLGHTIHNNGSM